MILTLSSDHDRTVCLFVGVTALRITILHHIQNTLTIGVILHSGHKHAIRIPLWRHKLNGEYSPPPEEVLGGIRYFRSVAMGLIVIYIRPSLALEKRRKALKSVREKDLYRTLNLYVDACKGWISKIVAVPVATLESDSTLDFEPRSYQVEAR